MRQRLYKYVTVGSLSPKSPTLQHQKKNLWSEEESHSVYSWCSIAHKMSRKDLCASVNINKTLFVLLCVNERCARVCSWRMLLIRQRGCQNLWCSELDSCGLLIHSVWTQNSYPLSCVESSFWQRLWLKMNWACCNEGSPAWKVGF